MGLYGTCNRYGGGAATPSPRPCADYRGLAPMRHQERKDKKFRLALGSFIEEYNNKVEIVTVRPCRRRRKRNVPQRC